jgi:enoyl-CoA hydratase/carnithine racemase
MLLRVVNSDGDVLVTEDAGVLTVRLRRPAKRNAINPPMMAALNEAAQRLGEREDLRAMLIAADGQYFTAGIDLAHPPGFVDGERVASDVRYRRDYRRHHLLYDEFEAIEKPVVIAIQGPCLGAGLEMAVSCDFRLASTAATFALPEIGLGVLPGSGGTSRLTRLVGPHWAKWIAMAGMPVSAEQALHIGLVHEVIAAEVFDQRVDEFMRRLVSLPLEALGLAKLVIDVNADVDRTSARHLERIANSPLNGSDEFRTRKSRFGGRA